jgi:pimeloyl-ACP methyl ester carboxylesterase
LRVSGLPWPYPSYDGTKLAFRRAGTGRPLVCLPGGPGRTPDYLGDLGGFGASRELILPDTRGTGESAVPADPATYRCDRLARDVEALRAELGLERFDSLTQVTTRGWMIPPGSPPGCWPSWADPPGR